MSFINEVIKCEVARTGNYGEDGYIDDEEIVYANRVFCENCGNDIYDPDKNVNKTYVYEYGGRCLCESCFATELFADLAPEHRTPLDEWEE